MFRVKLVSTIDVQGQVGVHVQGQVGVHVQG